MPEPELSLLFVRRLNDLGIRYMVSGSIAAILYGEPRLTHDVDFVVFLRPEEVQRLVEAFPAPEFFVPPPSAIAVEIAREKRGHFNIIHADTGFKADFYATGRDELHAWAFRRIRHLSYRGERVAVAPPEYVIVRKLEYFREGGSQKHLRDIQSMFAVSGQEVDRVELDQWIHRLGLEKEWTQLAL
jgi:hypothetical protein